MKIPLLARLFGANYKTSLTGLASTLSSLLVYISLIPYTLPTELSNVMSPEVKKNVFVCALVSKLIAGAWNAVSQKDKDVHGGTIIQNADNQAVDKTSGSNV